MSEAETIAQAEPAAPSRVHAATVTVAVAVVLAVVLGITAVLVSHHTASRQKDSRAAAASYLLGPAANAAKAAAVAETRATLTYNYKTLKANFAAAAKGLTPKFKASYLTTATASVMPLATKYHAVSSAAVTEAGVSAVSPTSATVLLFVDQTVENSQLANPRLDRSRVKASMVLVDGHWLINNLIPI
jgi:Mce-associated membrane protein